MGKTGNAQSSFPNAATPPAQRNTDLTKAAAVAKCTLRNPPILGRQHVPNNVKVTYNTTPPRRATTTRSRPSGRLLRTGAERPERGPLARARPHRDPLQADPFAAAHPRARRPLQRRPLPHASDCPITPSRTSWRSRPGATSPRASGSPTRLTTWFAPSGTPTAIAARRSSPDFHFLSAATRRARACSLNLRAATRWEVTDRESHDQGGSGSRDGPGPGGVRAAHDAGSGRRRRPRAAAIDFEVRRPPARRRALASRATTRTVTVRPARHFNVVGVRWQGARRAADDARPRRAERAGAGGCGSGRQRRCCRTPAQGSTAARMEVLRPGVGRRCTSRPVPADGPGGRAQPDAPLRRHPRSSGLGARERRAARRR